MITYPGLPIPTDPDGVDHPASPLSAVILRDLGARRFHTFNGWWAVTSQSWACPACGRDKRRIAYSTEGEAFAALEDHHDHAADAGATPVFDRVVVCRACNLADGAAKRMIRATLPAADRMTFWVKFSFSPGDIHGFVIRASNAKGHRLDRAAVAAAWGRRETDFRWRLDNPGRELPAGMRLLSSPGTGPLELLRAADAALSSMANPRTRVLLTASAWTYEAIVAPNARRSARSRRPPTQEEIDRAVANRLRRIPEHWSCPCCYRPLRDTVIRNGSKPPFLAINVFKMASAFGSEHVDLCHSCGLLLCQIGQQASRLAGLSRSSFSLDDIREFTRTERHVHHPDVDPDERDALILRVARRTGPCRSWQGSKGDAAGFAY